MATCHHLSGATWRKHCFVTVSKPPPDHRSTAAVNGGQRRSTPWTTGQRRRTTVDHRRTTGQPAGHGRVMDRVWIGSGPGRVRVGSGSSPPRGIHVDADVEMEALAWFEHGTFEGETMHTQPYRCASA
ncbi:hypothetical protein Tco_0929505 [Tanacetum coccineum]